MRSGLAAAATLASITLAACTDAPTSARQMQTSALRSAAESNGQFGSANEGLSTVLWNRKGVALARLRAGGAAGRNNAYVAIAQYRAVRAAIEARGPGRPSLAGAAAGASVAVLSALYPLDVASIDADLAAQRAAAPPPNGPLGDFAAGEAIGRAVAPGVLALAASDNFGLTPPPPPPSGPGYWIPSGAPIVRGGYGARPFFLTSASELRAPPPPTFGSADYLSALAEVRAISDTRTPEQVAITLKWVPFSGQVFNGIATDLMEKYHKSELESSRILAYASAAAYDAIIGCFDTKFTYWFIRPTQADPLITLATGLPNHPSYPSAHSCESGAWTEVLSDAFPSERASLGAIEQEASMSRVYGGLHYRFDGVAGLAIGHGAARLGLQRRGLE